MGWMKVLQEYPFLEWSDAPIWIVLSQEHGRVLSNSADVGLGYWDATYEHHISCDHEFGMAAKWVVDIWSANTVFVKNCPFQSLLSTYSISFRRCKLHPLVLHRQNMESTVGAACNISTESICSHGFSNSLSRQGGTQNKLNMYLYQQSLSVFSSMRDALFLSSSGNKSSPQHRSRVLAPQAPVKLISGFSQIG